MADKEIHLLPEATNATLNDLFAVEQNSTAKKMTAATLLAKLRTEIQDHGGIENITHSKSGNTTTVTFVLSDGSEFSFDVSDGQRGLPGQAGFSPTLEETPIENGYRVTVTDGDGTRSFTLYNGENGERGEDGERGESGVYIGDEEPTDPDVHVWIEPDAELPTGSILHIQDDEGRWHDVPAIVGPPGPTGPSPSVSITPIPGGHRLTITDDDGPHSADILNGDGSGDMLASTYDPQGKATDIFNYVDEHAGEGDMASSVYDTHGKATDIFDYADTRGGVVLEYGVTTFSEALAAFNNGSMLYAIKHPQSSTTSHYDYVAHLVTVEVNSSGSIYAFLFGRFTNEALEDTETWLLSNSGWGILHATTFVTTGRLGSVIAEVWDQFKTYNTGDYCINIPKNSADAYAGLYRSKTDNNRGASPAVGGTGSTQYWEKITAVGELSGVRDMISDKYSSTKTYAVGDYCIYNNTLWKCKVQHSGQTPVEGTYWTATNVAEELWTSARVTPLTPAVGNNYNAGCSVYKVGRLCFMSLSISGLSSSGANVVFYNLSPEISPARSSAFCATNGLGLGNNAEINYNSSTHAFTIYTTSEYAIGGFAYISEK